MERSLIVEFRGRGKEAVFMVITPNPIEGGF